jgi:hypothetical protein
MFFIILFFSPLLGKTNQSKKKWFRLCNVLLLLLLIIILFFVIQYIFGTKTEVNIFNLIISTYVNLLFKRIYFVLEKTANSTEKFGDN